MNEAITLFFSIQTAFLMLSVYILAFMLRRIVETAFPSIKKAAPENDPHPTYLTLFSIWWNQVILYAVPVLLGATMAFVPGIRHDGVGVGLTVMYGLIVGWFSSFLYKVFWKLLKARASALVGAAEPEPKDPTDVG